MSIVEITTFQLASGATETAFLAADRRVQTELVPNQPGFMRRTTARRDGAWLVVTLWGSEQQAQDFDSVAHGHPVQEEFDSFVEPGTVMTHRFETLD
jgi:hypothetical protein